MPRTGRRRTLLDPGFRLLLAPGSGGIRPGAAAAQHNPHLWTAQNPLGGRVQERLRVLHGATRRSTLRDGWCTAARHPAGDLRDAGGLRATERTRRVDLVGAGPGEVVEFDGRDAPADAKSKVQRLEASRLLKVALTYTQAGAERTAAGKLVSVGPEYAILESDGNSFAVPSAAVKKLQMLDLPLRLHVAYRWRTSIAAKGEASEWRTCARASTWIPAYTLRVLDEQTAELTLRGTLVNEAEDIVHADVHFVVGVPHFLHTQYLEPIAVGRVIRTIGRRWRRRRSRRRS